MAWGLNFGSIADYKLKFGTIYAYVPRLIFTKYQWVYQAKTFAKETYHGLRNGMARLDEKASPQTPLHPERGLILTVVMEDNTKKYHKAGWQTGNPRLYATNSQRAKQMRKEPTEAEYVFWNAVKGGKLGTKVRRQVTIGEYIADFLIPQYNIVIEIDGGIHLDPERVEWDRKRDEWMKKNG